MSKGYEGLREASAGGAAVWVETSGPPPIRRPLSPRFDLIRHSPDGFQWSYEGSGPAQLALALLADATRDDALAQRHYQDFKREIIAPLQGDHWRITPAEIIRWVEAAEARRGMPEDEG
jgi:Family of unknown function (DUF6166)